MSVLRCFFKVLTRQKLNLNSAMVYFLNIIARNLKFISMNISRSPRLPWLCKQACSIQIRLVCIIIPRRKNNGPFLSVAAKSQFNNFAFQQNYTLQ